jgi:hypothetical protein
MRNLPETPIIFLQYSPKSYFLAFLGEGVILIAISEINYIKHCTDRNYVHKHAYLGSDWSLRTPCGSLTQVALTGMRVVTQDFCRKSKLIFLEVLTCCDDVTRRRHDDALLDALPDCITRYNIVK